MRRALRRVDETVGAARERLRERGELETTLILVVSDHGATTVREHLDLAGWFRDQGIPTLSHPVIWERNPRAAVMVAGNGSAMIYARPGERRERRWPVERLRRAESFGVATDVIEALVAEPSVALVAGESVSGGLWVGNGTGGARIVAAGGVVTYTPVDGDPLGVGGSSRPRRASGSTPPGTRHFPMRSFISSTNFAPTGRGTSSWLPGRVTTSGSGMRCRSTRRGTAA